MYKVRNTFDCPNCSLIYYKNDILNDMYCINCNCSLEEEINCNADTNMIK